MKYVALFFLSFFATASAHADISISGIDGIGDWYLHVDLEEMRSTESGKKIYTWLEAEVFDELRKESGLELDKDIHQIIATSDGQKDVIFVMNGVVRQEHKDQIMALAATQNVELAPRKGGGREYFYMAGDGKGGDERFDKGAYFSLDIKNKVLLASSEATMKKLLGDGGSVAMRNKGSMLTVMAQNAMMDPNAPAAVSAEWDSNIIKNTEEAALVVSDRGGRVAVKAELVAREAQMAESLASIVRGLISLQAFNSDLEPEIAAVLKTAKVEATGKKLSISVDLDADTVIDNL